MTFWRCAAKVILTIKFFTTIIYKPRKIGQTDLVFGKSLQLVIMICATKVNTQTNRQLLTSYTISSASRTNATIHSILHN